MDTVLFADLRGSTGLFEDLGNAQATHLITHSVAAMVATVHPDSGRVVKTLGDGLMARFTHPTAALQAAWDMHACIERLPTAPRPPGDPRPARALQLQVGLAMGEVIDHGHDCFGDAVNVAARLLDHASDGETLITADIHQGLPARWQGRFRPLDWMHLRGRAEPVWVFVSGGRRGDAAALTQMGQAAPAWEPSVLQLHWAGQQRFISPAQTPLHIGRSPQAQVHIDDPRVSRLHARIDWQGSHFQLTDLSLNGSFIRFGAEPPMALRRAECTLHGHGALGLGAAPGTDGVPTLLFSTDDRPHPPTAAPA